MKFKNKIYQIDFDQCKDLFLSKLEQNQCLFCNEQEANLKKKGREKMLAHLRNPIYHGAVKFSIESNDVLSEVSQLVDSLNLNLVNSDIFNIYMI